MELARKRVIPATLDGWSLDVVRDLLAQGYQEGDRFDFKEMLPRDDAGRLRLSKTCCAFANSQGGYLVFGVVDAKVTVEQRLVGVDPTVDSPGSSVTILADVFLVWSGRQTTHQSTCQTGACFQSFSSRRAQVRHTLFGNSRALGSLQSARPKATNL